MYVGMALCGSVCDFCLCKRFVLIIDLNSPIKNESISLLQLRFIHCIFDNTYNRVGSHMLGFSEDFSFTVLHTHTRARIINTTFI